MWPFHSKGDSCLQKKGTGRTVLTWRVLTESDADQMITIVSNCVQCSHPLSDWRFFNTNFWIIVQKRISASFKPLNEAITSRTPTTTASNNLNLKKSNIALSTKTLFSCLLACWWVVYVYTSNLISREELNTSNYYNFFVLRIKHVSLFV